MGNEKNRIYFISDCHFGLDAKASSIEREKKFVRWMDSIKSSCKSLYMLGDIFDYWFEYNTVIPKGFTRVLAKIQEFVDDGIEVVYFTGNHDIWTFGYLEKELGVRVVRNEESAMLQGKNIYMAHGDGLGDPSRTFRFLRRFFRNGPCQWLFKWIHPDVTMPFGNWWSRRNRYSRWSKVTEQESENEDVYLGEDKEHLVIFAKNNEKTNGPKYDFYIFGHRHIELDLMINAKSRVIILGNWINKYTFGVLENGNFWLDNFFEDEEVNCCDLSNVV